MIDLYDVDAEKLGGNVRLMSEEMKKRGWNVKVPYAGSYNMFIDRGDGKLLHIYSAAPPATSYAAGYLTDDKYATSKFLESQGVNQLPVLVVENFDQSGEDFLHTHQKIVIKPLDGSHGHGVTVNITTRDQAEAACEIAKQHSLSGQILLQAQFASDKPIDLRVTVLNGICVGALLRVPANVTGDGAHTVRELIRNENQSTRGTAYVARIAKIDEMKAQEYLGERMSTIPAQGQKVSVLGIGNYGAGGELIDVTDKIPDWMRTEAEKIAKTTGLLAAGIDYMVHESIHKDVANTLEQVVLIEINKNPALFMHDLVKNPGEKTLISDYIDYLSTLEIPS